MLIVSLLVFVVKCSADLQIRQRKQA